MSGPFCPDRRATSGGSRSGSNTCGSRVGVPGARQPAEGTTTNDGGLAHGKGLALAEDGLATNPKGTTDNVGTSGAEAGVTVDAPGSGSTEPVAPPEAPQGMVKPAVQPKSPPAVPPTAMEEEDMVEEIIRAEPQTQSVRIFRKRGDDVVVVEEEDTPKEMRWLKTALAGVVKQIKVSVES